MPAAPVIAAERNQPDNTSDAHQVGHDKVPGPGDDRLIQSARAVKVLAELNGRLQLARELDVASEVVVDNWLLEPEEALIVERSDSAAKHRPATTLD